MRLRKNLPAITAATTTALVAATLMLPTTAYAASAGTTASAAGHAADTAPTVDGGWVLRTDQGYAFRATTTGDVDRVNFIVTPVYPTGGYGPNTTITVSQPGADGSWQTTGPLNLPYGNYYLAFQAVTPDGATSAVTTESGMLAFEPQPDFHNTTLTPGQLTYTSPTITTTGQLTIYNPDTGDTGTPWTDPITVQLLVGNAVEASTQTLGADGNYSFSYTPAINTVILPGGVPVTSEAVQVQADYGPAPLPHFSPESVATPVQNVAVVAAPTRIILDQSTAANLIPGTPDPITGTLQYQGADGWPPLPDTGVYLHTNNDPLDYYGSYSATTDADGRFTLTATSPVNPGTWTLSTTSYDGSIGSYFSSSQTSYTITSVQQQLTLKLATPLMNANSDLTFYQLVESTNSVVPGGHVYLQQSPNGSTGWTTVTALPAASNAKLDWTTVTRQVTDPHGYWRLYAPASAGFPEPAYSNTIHTFRYQTRITGGPTTTHAHKNQAVTFTGRLQYQGYGPWTALSGAIVELLYRPIGSTHTYVMGTTRTNSQGAFTTNVKITGNGTWSLAYQTTSNWFTDTSTNTYIQLL
jgi:hypothetical protein